MNTPLNIGLIGCGRVAERFYLPVLCRLADTRLVAVADPIPERRELLSSSIPGCLAFTSAEALLQKAGVEAIIITTPPATHVAIAAQSLRHGIHVLVEKPLAPSMAGVEELNTLVAFSGGSLMVGFNQRYWEPVCQLRQIMCNQHCFDTVSAKLIITSNIQAWSPICEISDPLDDLGSHQLDLLRYIFDREILAISARWTDKRAIEMEVRLAGGLVVVCLAAQNNLTREYIAINCEGRQYLIRLGSERIQPVVGLIRSVLDLSDTLRRGLLGRRSSLRDSYERQLIAFFNYVRTGTIPSPGIDDGIAVIRAVEAARQSAAYNGKEITIVQ